MPDAADVGGVQRASCIGAAAAAAAGGDDTRQRWPNRNPILAVVVGRRGCN